MLYVIKDSSGKRREEGGNDMKRIMTLALMLSLLCGLLGGCGTDAPMHTEATTKQTEATTKYTEPTTETSEPMLKGADTELLRIATVTDFGDVDDMSYNQAVYEAMVQWCERNGAQCAYFKTEDNCTAGRVAAIEQAIADGYSVLLLPGFSFAGAIVECAPKHPDVRFLGLDIEKGDLLEAAVGSAGETYDYNPDNWNLEDYVDLRNVYCCTYRMDVAGYMAGYAAVKMGYTQLGFIGAMAVPGVIRYGFGFIQGAEEAAKQTGVQVNIKHGYGYFCNCDGHISKSTERWYDEGTQVILSCGGGIWTEIAPVAMMVGGKIIGVDVDMAGLIESSFCEGLTVTSAMKDLAATTTMLLDACAWCFDGNCEDYLGKLETLGMPYLALPESTQWNESFTKQDFEALRQALMDGTLSVSDDISQDPVTQYVTVDYTKLSAD